MRTMILVGVVAITPTLCGQNVRSHTAPYPTFGEIVRIDAGFDAIVAGDAKIEKLAEGFQWAEGPVWLAKDKCLLFSDVPANIVYRWRPEAGVDVFLKPSGFTGEKTTSKQPGANGLAVDARGRLLLCQHGDRRVARLNEDKSFTTLADRIEGKRFNSPNDLAIHKSGDIYFSDPPWGLPLLMGDPGRELRFTGVFRVTPKGEVHLVTKDLFPNGLAFSPDCAKLYVAHGKEIVVFDCDHEGRVSNRKTFFDVSAAKGLAADGLKVDESGNVYAAVMGGGVFVLSPMGVHLGTIRTGVPTANCCFSDTGAALYITAGKTLARVRLLK
jgi:gluconolactonase